MSRGLRSKYPGHFKLARDTLKLAGKIRERAYELDPTLRPRTSGIATDSAMTVDTESIINRALQKAGLLMARYPFVTNRRRHALDEESRDLGAAYKHMYKAMDHLVDARDGKIDFDEDVFGEHVKNACDCLKAEDEAAKGGGRDRARGARDSLPRGMRRSVDLDTGFDADSLFQRDKG